MSHEKEIFTMGREQVHMVSIFSGGGEVYIIVFHALFFLSPFVRTFHRKAPEELFMKSDFCYSPTFSIHLHILGTYQQIKAF